MLRQIFLWLTVVSLACIGLAGAATAVVLRMASSAVSGWAFYTPNAMPGWAEWTLNATMFVQGVFGPIALVSLAVYLVLVDRALRPRDVRGGFPVEAADATGGDAAP